MKIIITQEELIKIVQDHVKSELGLATGAIEVVAGGEKFPLSDVMETLTAEVKKA